MLWKGVPMMFHHGWRMLDRKVTPSRATRTASSSDKNGPLVEIDGAVSRGSTDSTVLPGETLAGMEFIITTRSAVKSPSRDCRLWQPVVSSGTAVLPYSQAKKWCCAIVTHKVLLLMSIS